MFNWFKSKKNSIIPSDLEKGFLTSVFVNLKLNTHIDIPENVVCFACYKDKLYFETENELVIDKKNFLSLYKRQHKKDKDNNLDLDLYFVNLNSQFREFSYKDKMVIKRGLFKVNVKMSMDLKVEKAKKFLNSVRIDYALPYAVDVDNFIENYLVETTKMFFLRKNLISTNLDEKTNEKLTDKVNKFFKSIGMVVSNFKFAISANENFENDKISIFNNPKINENNKKESENLIDQTQKNDYNNLATLKEKHCPICGGKLIKGSKFCHICGATIKE